MPMLVATETVVVYLIHKRYAAGKERAGFSNSVKNLGFESCSNIFFPLGNSKSQNNFSFAALGSFLVRLLILCLNKLFAKTTTKNIVGPFEHFSRCKNCTIILTMSTLWMHTSNRH